MAIIHTLVVTGPIHTVMTEMNRMMREISLGQYIMTLSAVTITAEGPQRFTLEWLNAGAPPLMLLGADRNLRVLSSPGTPLGLQPELTLGQLRQPMTMGQRLFIFTDGLNELLLKNGDMLGMKRLGLLLAETHGEDAVSAAKKIAAGLDAAREGTPLADDVTYALLDVDESKARANASALSLQTLR